MKVTIIPDNNMSYLCAFKTDTYLILDAMKNEKLAYNTHYVTTG